MEFATLAARSADSLPDASRIWLLIGVMAVITFALRLAPFLAVHRLGDSPIVAFLGRTMPLGVLIILVIYTLSGTDVTAAPFGLPELAAVGITAALHLWRGNVLLSLVGGTGAYVALLALI